MADELTYPIDQSALTGALAQLARPFTAAAIRFKPQSVVNGRSGGKIGLVTYYIDARLAAARLDTVIGAGGWSTESRVIAADPKLGLPIECRLTVLGVTKANVGQISPGTMDEKAWKSAYSDALKRAAVLFGIGAYLYGGPQVWAEVKVGNDGKAKGFSDAGMKAARDAYAKWIGAKDMVALWGDPLDHGDIEHEPIGAEEIAEEQPPPEAATAVPAFMLDEALTCLSGFTDEPRPWIVEAAVGFYPDVDAFPEKFDDLPEQVRGNLLARLKGVCGWLKAAEEKGFNPQADERKTQELLSWAFAKSFDELEVKGPDDFRLPLPF